MPLLEHVSRSVLHRLLAPAGGQALFQILEFLCPDVIIVPSAVALDLAHDVPDLDECKCPQYVLVAPLLRAAALILPAGA